jgi:alpha-2-macroglobulin
MNSNIPPSSGGFTRLAKSIFRFFALIFSALIGTWQPPVWLRWSSNRIFGTLSKRPKLWSGIALAAILITVGIQQWQKWWEMHRPQERQLVAKRDLTYTISTPSATSWHQGVPTYGSLHITFSDAAAPLEKIEQVVTDVVKMSPSISGTWKWSNDRILRFTPEKEWQAGEKFSLSFNKKAFPNEVVLTKPETNFETSKLSVTVSDFKFYTQPDQPEVHELTATIDVNYALTQEALQGQMSLVSLAEKPQAFGGEKPGFTLSPSDAPNKWYFRSSRVRVPEETEEVKLTIAKALRATSGGNEMTADLVKKARVPSKYSALKIESQNISIIKNQQGEPKQFLTFQSSLGISPAEVNKHVKLWRLAPADDKWLVDNEKSENDITPEMMSRATSILLERVQNDGESPFPDEHAYQFFSPVPGRMYFQVMKGMEALGGFVLAERHHKFIHVPDYPLELEWTGKGNILALNGERTIQFKSRGVEFILITCGRIRAGEINHMITQNDYGDFSAPSLEGDFGKDSLVRTQTFVLRVDKKNDWDACFTAFDLNKAMAAADPSDPETSRGLYFVEAHAVHPILPGEPDTSVYSRVEEPSGDWEVQEEIESGGYYSLNDGQAKKIYVNTDGSVAHPSTWFSDVKPDGTVNWDRLGQQTERFVMLTDLGLLAKTNADLSRDVFVMSLKAQKPVSGASVEMLARNGSSLGKATTDALGRASLPKPTVTAREQQPVAIVVRQGKDLSFIPIRPGHLPAMDYSRYDVDGVLASRTKGVEAHLFTERGVYRPGDKVHFAAIVKRRDWQAVIEGLPVRAELTDVTGRTVGESSFKLSADGLIDGEFQTSETDPTGLYELSLRIENSPSHNFLLGRIPLRVEDFRPDRMKMKVEFEPTLPKGWVKPGELAAKISLENLFGAAAGDRRVTGVMHLDAADFRFPAWPNYQFYNTTRSKSYSIAGDKLELGEVKTSPEGDAEMPLDLAKFDKVNMSVALHLEAFESDGGHGVREQRSFLVSPGDYVAGFNSDVQLDYLGKDAGGKVKFIALDQNLQAVAVENLRYRINETRYVSVLRKDDNGNMSYESQERDTVLSETKDINWTAGPVEVNLETSKVGHFTFQVINDLNDVICEFPYRVVGKGDEEKNLERDAELTLTIAEPKVLAGGEVEVSIVAPYKGAGLITIEREKVLHAQWFTADTNASVHKVKIPADIEGTVYCNVSFVRSLDSPDVFMTPLSYATQPLTIEPSGRILNVELNVPKIVRPGQELKINYRADRESRIVIYAVDEGIHQITRYKRPEPLNFFFRKQALEVRTQQWFDLLMPEYRFIKDHAAFGGDGGDEMDALSMTLNPFKRKRDAPVVWWSGIKVAGPESKEISYTVPDYFAGTLTVMAVAVNETRAGSAQTSSLVQTPLVLTLNSPTTVTPGDEFVVSVTLTNLLEKEGLSNVALSVEPSPHLQIIGDAGAEVSVEKSREITQRFRFKALDSLGSGSVKCFAKSGTESSVRTETMSIRPAAPFRTQVRSAYIRTSKHEQEVTRSLYDAYRRSEVVASPLPVVLALGMRDYMNAYPYDCTEQLTSKGITLLSYRAMEALPQQGDLTTSTISTVIQQLQSRQSNSGGFGYWRGSTSDSDDFLNCYATHFLREAKDAGFDMPYDLLRKSSDKMKKICESGEISNLEEADRKAYAIYLLAREGQRANGLASLRESLDRTQKGRWQNRLCGSFLAATYKLLQEEKKAEEIVKTWKLATADQYRNGENYWSRAEVDELLSFAIRARHFPDAVKNYGYADWQKLYGVLWQDKYNTITAACATLGMREFSKVVKANAFEFEVSALPRVGSTPIPLLKTKEIFGMAPFAENMKALEFRLDQKDGDQGLFYQVVEEGFDRQLPTKPQKDGIEVYREITTLDGKPIESLKVGESLKMTLRVRNISKIPLGNLVMVDLLPGGFSMEPGDMKAGISTVAGTERVDIREDRNLFFFSLQGAKDLKIEYELRATSAGDFVVPPLFAESMYDRGINGVGLGNRIKVLTRE